MEEPTSFIPRQHLDYPDMTMFQMVERNAVTHPQAIAYEFFSKKTDYKTFVSRIERAARAFAAAGIRRDDVVTICLPNIPQALICFYALDRLGAVANMVHPLSAQKEISFYLNFSGRGQSAMPRLRQPPSDMPGKKAYGLDLARTFSRTPRLRGRSFPRSVLLKKEALVPKTSGRSWKIRPRSAGIRRRFGEQQINP